VLAPDLHGYAVLRDKPTRSAGPFGARLRGYASGARAWGRPQVLVTCRSWHCAAEEEPCAGRAGIACSLKFSIAASLQPLAARQARRE